MQVRWVKWPLLIIMWQITVKTAEQMELFYALLYFSFWHGCSIMVGAANMQNSDFCGCLTVDNPIERINFYMICNKELPFNSIIYTLNPISQVIIFSYHMFPRKKLHFRSSLRHQTLSILFFTDAFAQIYENWHRIL